MDLVGGDFEGGLPTKRTVTDGDQKAQGREGCQVEPDAEPLDSAAKVSDEDRMVVPMVFGEGSEECVEPQTGFCRELGFPFPMNPFESPLKEALNAVVKGGFPGLEKAKSTVEDGRERDAHQQDLPPQEKAEKAGEVGGLGAVVAQERGGCRGS